MTGAVVSLDAHRRPSPGRHRLRRFAFRAGINRQAQQVLADLMRQLASQQDGLIDCQLAFDPATGEWIEHSVWRADRAPPGDDVPSDEAGMVMRRLRMAGG